MIQVGILGGGWATRNIWLPCLLDRPNCDLVGIADPEPSARASLAHSHPELPVFDDTNVLLDGGADLIIVATPNHLHVPQAKACFERRLHVMVEKPACFTLREARELAQLAASKERGFWVSSASLERADIRQMHSIIASGKLGPIRCIDVSWIRATGIPRPGSWFTRRSSAIGGVGADLGWHMLDVGLSLLGHPETTTSVSTLACDPPKSGGGKASWYGTDGVTSPNQETAVVDVETQAFAAFATDCGSLLRLTVAWVSHESADETRVTVYGRDGTLRLRTMFGFSTDTRGTPSLTFLRDGREERLPLSDPPKIQPYQSYTMHVLEQIESGSRPSARPVLSVAGAIEKLYASEFGEGSVLQAV